jgi:hypothetical protein
MWLTSTGIFVQINGTTVNLTGAASTSFAATSPLAVTFPGGIVTYACATCAITTNPLSQFAATTSAQLRGVLSDETGTGVAVFQNGALGTPTATSLALGGATIGTNALAVTGTSLFNTGVTMSAALTYGGVTLANSVTGTGSMVLGTSPSLTTPTLGVATGTSLALGGATIGSNAISVTGSSNFIGAMIVSSASSAAISVGANGSLNPALLVDASTASSATGIDIKSAAAGSGAAISVTSSGTNEGMTINAKGSGAINIGGISTGVVSIGAGGGGITTPSININSTNALTGIGSGVPAALAAALSANGGVPTVVAHGTATLGTSAIASGACATVVTATATGAATTDIIDAVFNADPTSTVGYTAPNMLTIMIYPTSNTANFKVCNNTANSITPGAAITLNWAVRR